ncbi:MAG TPA: class I SAM-dependent methyltransferase [Acidimicrobiales bacterium]|nr:class I SAM-dependent methyltransferase [Acidimicrobiales bacterium]
MTNVPLSDLPANEKAERASSFGGVAEQYESFRPAPAESSVDWLLDGRRVAAAVDLGAGTGACTRLLLARVETVAAVEPDERMRVVLRSEVPTAKVLDGRGELIPLPDASVDAVVASSSWHWMEPEPTLREVARVLRPGGTLGVLWSAPDPEGPFMAQARALLESQSFDAENNTAEKDSSAPPDNLANVVLADADRPSPTLEIPDDLDLPFEQPDFAEFREDLALTADQMIGLMGTLSIFILMPEERRLRIFDQTRRLLRDALGIDGETTADLTFKTDAWRARRR